MLLHIVLNKSLQQKLWSQKCQVIFGSEKLIIQIIIERINCSRLKWCLKYTQKKPHV